MIKKISIYCIFSFFLSFSPYLANAKKIPDMETKIKSRRLINIPHDLKDWKDWVTQGKEKFFCPPLYNSTKLTQCFWPSRLKLDLDAKGGSFYQEWDAFTSGWVYLPGDEKRWPNNVSLDGNTSPVTSLNMLPAIFIDKGKHRITGNFSWNSLPEYLKAHQKTGIIDLTIKEKKVKFPQFDSNGIIWLQKKVKGNVSGNNLDIKVYRLLTDSIPFKITTHIDLNVSGEGREEFIGPATMSNSRIINIFSQIPVRLQPNGKLLVQVRPGKWSITLKSIYMTQLSELKVAYTEENWPLKELWAFQAQNHMRIVSIEGPDIIDPNQTEMPGNWKKYPTYLMTNSSTMKIIEKKRGDPEPGENHLTIKKSWWLDFDGIGYTVHDKIAGTIRKDWRLEMNPPSVLGHVNINGKDHLITKKRQEEKSGIEIRQGNINITADSRIDEARSTLPSVGWNHDFQKVSGTLELPPGWRLIHASGVDHVSGAWLSDWTLLDLFIVLIISVSFYKLYGIKWGVIALLTLTLTYHEHNTPKIVWLSILAATALLRMLPEGKLKSVFSILKSISIFCAVLISVPFIVNHLRTALYPQLDYRYAWRNTEIQEKRQISSHSLMEKQLKRKSRALKKQKEKSLYKAVPMIQSVPGNTKLGQKLYMKKDNESSTRNQAFTLDPNVLVQTGPGLPSWRWNQISLNWKGPVIRDQSIRLWLVSPFINLILSLLRVILLLLLILCTSELWKKKSWLMKEKTISLGIIFLLFIPALSFSEIPSKEILKEFEERLLKKVECLPECAQIQSLIITVDKDNIQMTINIHADSKVAVPIPVIAGKWIPHNIKINETTSPAIFRSANNTLWIIVNKGINTAIINGHIPMLDATQIILPLKPHFIKTDIKGWILEGLHKDGSINSQLQLKRIIKRKKEKTGVLDVETLPPFVTIERTLSLGLSWKVYTKVTRVTPTGSAIVLSIPKLVGEFVITSGIHLKNQKILLHMAPNQRYMEWVSNLEIKNEITLESRKNTDWTEIWTLDASPVWHCNIKGIPVIHHQNAEGLWMPKWSPWPGDKISIIISRPEGVKGQSVTIDRVSMNTNFGSRYLESTLNMTIRTSRGGEHTIKVPPGILPQRLIINNKSEPVRKEEDRIYLSLVPGVQNVQLVWNQNKNMKNLVTMDTVDLGNNAVNVHIQAIIPTNRWILLIGGPSLGPAVQFWSKICAIFLFAYILHYIKFTPLKFSHWFLLMLGLTQVNIISSVSVIGWLLVLGVRKEKGKELNDTLFNLFQIGLPILTIIALSSLYSSIRQGLLGLPDMQIGGNNSSNYVLKWYQDQSTHLLPQPWIFSISIWYYKILMLIWGIWISSGLLKWINWGWICFSENGYWKKKKKQDSNK